MDQDTSITSLSSLSLLLRKKWLRRFYMIAIGLCLGYYYFFLEMDDIIFTPFLIGTLVGLLSHSLLVATVNTLIVLFSMIFLVTVSTLSSNLGSGEIINVDYHLWIISEVFILASIPIVAWVPGLFFGYILRHAIKYMRRLNS